MVDVDAIRVVTESMVDVAKVVARAYVLAKDASLSSVSSLTVATMNFVQTLKVALLVNTGSKS
jgi:hypothetical protein